MAALQRWCGGLAPKLEGMKGDSLFHGLLLIAAFLCKIAWGKASAVTDTNKFPDNFLIGASTAAFQIEGGWNEDGKGESIWDHLVHNRPDLVVNGANADVACDSYHKYKEDVQMLKEVGFTHYRFSVSWPRILPTGFDNQINPAGIKYYHNLIDELIKNNIIPVVIMYHWDLPQPLQQLGGWANPLMVDYFARYAKILFKEYGKKVKWWTTINEPFMVTTGYGSNIRAPLVNMPGIADYLSAHYLLLAHSKVYHMYDKEFRRSQKGQIGITLSAQFASGLTNSAEDAEAAVRSMQFHAGLFAHPIFSSEGDYPKIVKDIVAANSKAEGYSTSRLPVFTQEQIEKLKVEIPSGDRARHNSSRVTVTRSLAPGRKMNLLNVVNRKRYEYDEYEDPSKEKSKHDFWMCVLFFGSCVCFGFTCFYWAHMQLSSNSLWLQLNDTPHDGFPAGFRLGCASSAYQVEGAWDEDGKGENIWDRFVHEVPSLVKNNDTGDVACDSYHRYKRDVKLIKNVGFGHYRFSISWARVLPTGYGAVNPAGLQYYHRLVDDLLANGISPMITLYHWDLPQALQDLGGWPNPKMAEYFENYANIIFQEFASKVKWWITINEPHNVIRGYSGRRREDIVMAPRVMGDGVADYLAAHTLLRAHAKAYRLFDSVYRPAYGGRISISIDAQHYQPETDSEENKMAAMRAAEFKVGLFAHPIFSKEGDFPKIVKERVGYNSEREGRANSRLPAFTKQDVDEIKGTFDFFGLNHYTSYLVTAGKNGPAPSLLRDAGVLLKQDPSWPQAASSWLRVVPWGLRALLNNIKTKYNDPAIFITENGFSTKGGVETDDTEDNDRISYYHAYLEQLLLAMHEDSCNVVGYTAWSILDNFEWSNGYTERFGLHFVNFSDPLRRRTEKKSAAFFRTLIQTRRLPQMNGTYLMLN